MDYIPESDAIRAMARAIEDDVIPYTAEGYPRGQLWAISGMLRNLAIDMDNRVEDAAIETIQPVSMTLEVELEGDYLAQATMHHERLVDLIARQAPLNSGRALLGR